MRFWPPSRRKASSRGREPRASPRRRRSRAQRNGHSALRGRESPYHEEKHVIGDTGRRLNNDSQLPVRLTLPCEQLCRLATLLTHGVAASTALFVRLCNSLLY